MTLSKEYPQLSVGIIDKNYGSARPVLSNIAFTIMPGSFVSILGPSGCGKTTLLKMIAGLDVQYNGTIEIGQQAINKPTRDIGIMFQDTRLLGWRTVEQNIGFALPKNLGRTEYHKRVDQALELVGLFAMRKSWPSQLSGGMERRVGLARAIVNLPKLLLLDEPFSALDFSSKAKLWNEIEIIHKREDLTTILVTHDLEEALYLSDTMIFLGQTPATIMKQTIVEFDRPRAKFMKEIAASRAEMMAAELGG